MVIHIDHDSYSKLAGVVEATDLPRLALGPAERGEEHAREYADDGDHHQQFDQGETMIRALGYWKTHTFSWALLRTPSLPGSRCE